MIYPVAPGEVVGDAPREANLFAVELIKSAKVQGLPFKEVLRRVRTAVAQATRDRQIVWESSPAPEEFVISSKVAPTPIRAADPVEQGFWERSRAAATAADFKAYLDSYPDGPFAVAARARLQQIEARQAKPKPGPKPGLKPRPKPNRRRLHSRLPRRNPPSATVRNVPKLYSIPPGAFEMGSSEMFDFEAPVHQVSIRKAVLHRPARSHVRGVGRMSCRRRLQAKAG